jgi:hypothetical protein
MTLAEQINVALDQGFTVSIRTATRVTNVTTKTRDSWRAAGHEFFRTSDSGALLMIEGQKAGNPRHVVLLPGGYHLSAVKVR